MNWLAPTFGLLGVVVGGFLNATVTRWSENRRARAGAMVTAVLLLDELHVTDDRVRVALDLGRWGPVLDPGLPYASGLWAVEHRGGERGTSVWIDGRQELAPFLLQEWEKVSQPFRLIDKLSSRFWVDDPDRQLGDDERVAFDELRQAIAEAAAVLDRLRMPG
jgi:hypothetical protein